MMSYQQHLQDHDFMPGTGPTEQRQMVMAGWAHVKCLKSSDKPTYLSLINGPCHARQPAQCTRCTFVFTQCLMWKVNTEQSDAGCTTTAWGTIVNRRYDADSCQSVFYAPQRISPCINKHLITLNCFSFGFYEYLMEGSNEIVLE